MASIDENDDEELEMNHPELVNQEESPEQEKLRKSIYKKPLPEPEDVKAFDAAISECREIFLERRDKDGYGSHLDKHPLYALSGAYMKAIRLKEDFERRQAVKRDTLIDEACFSLMALSRAAKP